MKFKRYPLSPICFVLATLWNSDGFAGERYFNAGALEAMPGADTQSIDLSRFNQAGQQLPGTYTVAITVNATSYDKNDLKFVIGSKGKLVPEITVAQLKQYGLNTGSIAALSSLDEESLVTDISEYIPDASFDFNFNKLILAIHIPQAYLNNRAEDFIDPSEWNDGLPVLMTSYNFSGSQTRNDDTQSKDNSMYLNLNSGANLGAWRVRNFSTWRKSHDEESSWDPISSYLQRDIKSLRSQLAIGDKSTGSDIFDSVQFRGITLGSEDNMRTDREAEYAPVIRGIARSANAKVTVSQNGNTIYETYVPAGAFTISDLYALNNSGNLDVTVMEADGQKSTFSQSYGSVPLMQREGQLKYEITLGEYRQSSLQTESPRFAQLTSLYGLPHDMTLYGGLINAENYRALQAGYGLDLGGLGSVSLDITHSNTDIEGSDTLTGQQYRLQYAKSLSLTNTEISATYESYPGRHYFSFEDSVDYYREPEEGERAFDNKHNRIELMLNQPLGPYGSLSFSGNRQTYWRSGSETNISTTWNATFHSVNVNLAYTRSLGREDAEDLFLLSLQVPLSEFLPKAWSSYSLSTGKSHKTVQTAGINGSALSDSRLNYNVSVETGEAANGGSLNLNYKSKAGEARGGYSSVDGSRRASYGLQGGLIIHPYGATLSQSFNNESTLALVRMPDAANVNITNGTALTTDFRGYAVVPNIQPYRRNTVSLDPKSYSQNMEVSRTALKVTPNEGAVALASFDVKLGERVLVTIVNKGKPVPFGSIVSLEGGESSGIVADQGLVYLAGIPPDGTLNARWGTDSDQQCKAVYELPGNATDNEGIREINVNCL
jgi:outer membrane usher protein